MKFRYVGGAPYTPYDVEKSSLKEAWDLQGQGYLDYTRFNSLRLKGFNQLDIRVDKRYFYKNWSLMLYVDIQNVLNSKAAQPPILIRETGSNGIPVTKFIRYLQVYPEIYQWNFWYCSSNCRYNCRILMPSIERGDHIRLKIVIVMSVIPFVIIVLHGGLLQFPPGLLKRLY